MFWTGIKKHEILRKIAERDYGKKASKSAPAAKQRNYEKLLALGKFIAGTLKTAINVKKWWMLNQHLLGESNKPEALKLLNALEEIALDEIKNAEETIPLVESYSRLGWEPSMEYMTDREHLEWKIRQVRTVLDCEIPAYRKIIRL